MSSDLPLYRAVLKNDLLAFLEGAFPVVDNRWGLEVAPYLEYLVSELTGIAEGRETRLIINLPPRHLKSVLTSIVFVAWLLGRDPKLRIAVISHSQALASDLASKTLQLISSDFYRRVFPGLHLRDNGRKTMDFVTTDGGGRYAASFETGITGRGFDVIIIDDPISAHHVKSEKERANVNENFDTMIASRLDDQIRGAMIVVGQRMHEDDLSGNLLQKGGWKHVCLPLVAEEAASYTFGKSCWHRTVGEPLLASQWPEPIIRRKREEVGAPIFAAQYQQNPSAAFGELIRPDQILHFSDLPPDARRITLSWDTAVKTGSDNSYTVCLVIARDARRHYVVDVLRARVDPVQMRDAALGLITAYKPSKILIEDASSGTGLASMLAERGHQTELRPTGGRGKEERLESQLHMFAQHLVLIKRNQPWTVELESELMRFPFGKHNDQVDALTQYLAWIAESPMTNPVVMGAGGKEARIERALSRRPWPVAKGDNPLRPRGGPVRRW
ncbi:phage terminase large subunit [Afipia sp. DC4300-2b1]|uniref:phage terminase large subunit n=1 Tax=Afipia sp. DC4300-2b1 TaxID=2804672 RepID=UPI003CF7FF7B